VRGWGVGEVACAQDVSRNTKRHDGEKINASLIKMSSTERRHDKTQEKKTKNKELFLKKPMNIFIYPVKAVSRHQRNVCLQGDNAHHSVHATPP